MNRICLLSTNFPESKASFRKIRAVTAEFIDLKKYLMAFFQEFMPFLVEKNPFSPPESTKIVTESTLRFPFSA